VAGALTGRTKDAVETAEEGPIVLGATLLTLLAFTTLPTGKMFICFPELEFSTA
jgi:hypothetical protein